MILAALLAVQAPAFDFDVTSAGGLSLTVGGVPVVRGSQFQYYEPGWSKGYFSSPTQGQKVERAGPDQIRTTFSGGGASGGATYRREGNRLVADYRFGWYGESPAMVELGHFVWAPAFEAGSLTADGSAARSLASISYTEPGIGQRRFAPDGKTYVLDSSIAKVTVEVDKPVPFFDARGYNQPWAEGAQVWWLGPLGLEAKHDQPATLRMVWQIEPKANPSPQSRTVNLSPVPVKQARLPDTARPLLVPRPKTVQLEWDKPIVLTGKYTYPAGRVRFMSDFTMALANRFEVPKPDPAAVSLEIDAGVSKLGLKPGGYRIILRPGSISVLGEEDEGLRNGWRRLAQLVYVQNGKLCLPTGAVVDQPTIEWRGVHLFVGPEARAFQRNLWLKVLLPMGYNHVVLQCERTAWKSTPGTATAMTMSREDLAALFDSYRSWNVEPTPLIQSWGHVEWLFANNRNTGLRYNPDSNYSIDPRKPESRKMIEAIWDEAAALLKLKTMHFGLDEVDMRGWPDDPELVTTIWEDYLPFLAGIAQRHKAEFGLWGDKMLAPGQAPDATHGATPEHALRRRKALPKRSVVFDWHYKDDPDPRVFYPSLRLFRDEGHVPIASGWYAPQNVRGLATAADIQRAGYLQTTWAGYESNEASMIANIRQFSAMILAAEYAWAGQDATPDKLGYDPIDLFRRLYFGRPSPLKASPGVLFRSGAAGKETSVDGISFELLTEPLRLASAVAGGEALTLTIPIKGQGRSLWLLLDASVPLNEGELAATVEATLADGKKATRSVRYGHDVRVRADNQPTYLTPRLNGLSAVRLGLPSPATLLQIRADRSLAGVRVHGVTLTD